MGPAAPAPGLVLGPVVAAVGVVPAAPVDRVVAARAARAEAAPGNRAVLVEPTTAPVGQAVAARVDLVAPVFPVARTGPEDRTDQVVPTEDAARVGRAVLVDRTAREGLTVPAGPTTAPGDQVGRTMARVAPVDRTDRVDEAAREVPAVPTTARVAPAVRTTAREAPAVRTTVRVGLAVPVDRMAPEDLAGMDADPVDPVVLPTYSVGSTTAVVPTGVARGTHRMASVRPIVAHRRHRGKTDSGGTAGLRRERHRRTGTGRRLQGGGTDRLLPGVGTPAGMGRRVTSVTPSAISVGSTTAATTRYRSSTRFSADGDSGTSASGFRCTDLR